MPENTTVWTFGEAGHNWQPTFLRASQTVSSGWADTSCYLWIFQGGTRFRMHLDVEGIGFRHFPVQQNLTHLLCRVFGHSKLNDCCWSLRSWGLMPRDSFLWSSFVAERAQDSNFCMCRCIWSLRNMEVQRRKITTRGSEAAANTRASRPRTRALAQLRDTRNYSSHVSELKGKFGNTFDGVPTLMTMLLLGHQQHPSQQGHPSSSAIYQLEGDRKISGAARSSGVSICPEVNHSACAGLVSSAERRLWVLLVSECIEPLYNVGFCISSWLQMIDGIFYTSIFCCSCHPAS